MPRAPDLSGIALDGRYELHAVIGEGTFGRVYRGRDRRLARPVAVKVIKPWWAEDPDWVRTFEREAQLLASVSDPGIVQIFDVGSAPEGLYYVAELVEGESLAARLRRRRLTAEEARDVAEQLARALSKAHAQRVVHRDVKPANVLISRDGRIKVGDFGVAHLAEGSSDGAATIAGTPRYMAPEQSRGQATTPATDVYGVGIVLYEMLAGHPPFDGSSPVELALRHVHDEPPSLPAGTPPALVAITRRALAKDPFERYANGLALADALARARHAPDSRRTPDVQHDHDATPAGTGGGVATVVRPSRAAPARTKPLTAPTSSTRRPDPTVFGEPMSPRRNLNPAARRRRVALVACVVLIAAAMGAGAIALAPGHLIVPNLHGMSRGRIAARAHRLDFTPVFNSRYSSAPKGTAIAQSPVRGVRVTTGTPVTVTLSAGPPPVPVPQLVRRSLTDAKSALGRKKLRATVTRVPAPGTSPGTVVRQSPRAGVRRPVGSAIKVDVAEVPRLRALTSGSGEGKGSSVVFEIRGNRWNVITDMSYQGECTWIFVCSGPSATVTDVTTHQTVTHFSLGEGSHKVATIASGPGLYQVTISPGSDTARWGFKVDDYY